MQVTGRQGGDRQRLMRRARGKATAEGKRKHKRRADQSIHTRTYFFWNKKLQRNETGEGAWVKIRGKICHMKQFVEYNQLEEPSFLHALKK